jgi:ankyrin repeat protein
MVFLLPPLASIPSLWSSPLLDNSYLSGHIFKVSARSGKRILKNIKESIVLTLVEGILIDKKAGKSYKIKEQHWIVSEGLGSLRVYLLESPLVILSSSPSFDEIISGIENGNQTLKKIADRIQLFNDFAVDLTLMEIREDIQKLLADAQFLLSSTLGETLVKRRMADLLIPSWDSLFCIIEKHCMQQTYDIIFFKVSKNNLEKDEMIANIMKKTRLALLGGIRLNLSTIIEVFQEIEQVRSPFEKIQILKKSIQAIIDSKSSLSNDELLPIFITVVLRSQVSSLYSNLELITQFTFEKKVDQGEIGYLLSTLEATADFILNNEEDLEANSIFFEEFQNTLETKDLDKIDQFYEKKIPKHVDKNMHSFCDQYGNDAVMLSIESHKLIDYFLTQKKFDPSFQSLPAGNSYFHLCASKNLIESAMILAEKKADATLVNSDGETPFCIALHHGYIDFAKMLVSYNNSVKNHIIIPKVFQLLSNNSITLDYLLAFPINFNNVFVGDKSLLTYFCSLAKPELAISLLTSSKLNPINFCSQDAYGKTFVHYCCSNVDNYAVAISFFKIASSEIIEKTLSVLDLDGNTALHIAALNDNFKMVRELLQHQKNIDIRNLRDLAAFEMTFDEKIVAEILNERIIRYSQIRKIGISVFSHSRWIANGKLTFQIRSVKKKNIENVHVVKRSLDEFTYFRECLILERPESVMWVLLIIINPF